MLLVFVKLLLQGEQHGIPSLQEFGRGWFVLTKCGCKRGYSAAADLDTCFETQLGVVPSPESKETLERMACVVFRSSTPTVAAGHKISRKHGDVFWRVHTV